MRHDEGEALAVGVFEGGGQGGEQGGIVQQVCALAGDDEGGVRALVTHMGAVVQVRGGGEVGRVVGRIVGHLALQLAQG